MCSNYWSFVIDFVRFVVVLVFVVLISFLVIYSLNFGNSSDEFSKIKSDTTTMMPAKSRNGKYKKRDILCPQFYSLHEFTHGMGGKSQDIPVYIETSI